MRLWMEPGGKVRGSEWEASARVLCNDEEGDRCPDR
jgi:hypothetical protein